MKISKNCKCNCTAKIAIIAILQYFAIIEKDSETISGIDNPSNSKYVECSFAENDGLDV